MTISTLNPPGSDADSGRAGAAPPTTPLEPPALADLPRAPAQPPSSTTAPPGAPRRARRWWIVTLAAGLAVVLALVGSIVWRNWVPSAPGTPTAGTVTATSVQLRWAASTQGPSVDAYLIQRDGVQVGTVAGTTTTYVDRGLAPDSSHRYAVIAGSGSKRSAPSAETVLRTLPAAPTALDVVGRTTASVTLRWSPPTTGRVPDGYVVLRDGKDVANLPGAARSYRDAGLVPVTTYSYTVVTVKDSLRSAPSAALDVTTLAPPVTSARVSGTFIVDGKVVSAPAGDTIGGAPSVGQTFSSTWTFTPKGSSTPSSVVVSGEFVGHPFSVTLRPSGGAYTGSTKTHLTHCDAPNGSRDITDTVRLSLRVKTAEVVSKAWSAMSWTGRLKVDNPYTAVGNTGWYCPSGSLTATLTGTPLSATS